jgi:plasmid stabilization system protein ParE
LRNLLAGFLGVPRSGGAKTRRPDQTLRYLDDLEAACQRLAENPATGRSCDQIRPGLRRMEQGRHVIFFRIPVFATIMAMIMSMLQMNSISGKFTSMDSRFTSLGARFTTLEANMNNRFNSLESRFDTLTGKVIEIDNRLIGVEAILERH